MNNKIFRQPVKRRQVIHCISVLVLVLGMVVLAACTSSVETEKTPPPPTEAPAVEPSPVEPTSVVETVAEPPVTATGDAAGIAVQAAKQYAGITLRISYEAGLQALDGHFFGPEWTRLTGIEVQVVEYGFDELYDKTLANADPLDVVSVVPAWMGDFVAGGVLEPLDDYVAQYYPAAELESFHPTFRDNWMKVGDVIYGIPDDGDVMTLYYRRDLFEDPDNQSQFESAYAYALQPPETWEQWDDICAFFTDKYAPDIYGCAIHHKGQNYHWFQSIFRSQGGEFFDPETMKAQINDEIGVQAANILLSSMPSQPPGAKDWEFIDAFGAWIGGNLAMTLNWPPVGRWSEGYGSQVEQLDWVPETQVAGKVGYALQPDGGELATGFNLAVSAHSSHKEAAYLFVQWLTSEEISLQRTMTPFALRDPYRLTHYESALYRTQWAGAAEYLQVLQEGASTGYMNIAIPGAREYEQAEKQALIAMQEGAEVQETLDALADEWDAITERLGVEAQREAYLAWRELPNAYPNRAK